jgi:hypothetical protein
MWTGGILLQLPPQVSDVHPQHVQLGPVSDAPYLSQQLLPREDLPPRPDQSLQDVIFRRRKLYWASGHRDNSLGQVHSKVAGLERGPAVPGHGMPQAHFAIDVDPRAFRIAEKHANVAGPKNIHFMLVGAGEGKTRSISIRECRHPRGWRRVLRRNPFWGPFGGARHACGLHVSRDTLLYMEVGR